MNELTWILEQRRMRYFAWAILTLSMAVGCNQGPFAATQPALMQQQQQQQALASQMQLRAEQLDANNRDLHAQLAQSQQQSQVLREEVDLLRERLSDTASQLQQVQVAKTETDKRLEGMQASAQRRGGAMITANSSLRNNLKVVDAPGLDIRLDGDVVRIEVPSDKIFAPGTFQFVQGAEKLLDDAATVVKQSYPRQLVAIEAHTDSNPPPAASGVSSNHQLAASQAILVFDHITRRNLLPPQQLFTVAQGGNHPLASNATPAGAAKNRRIEFVVYPETMGQTR